MLQIDGVRKGFDGKPVLDGLSLSIAEGQVHGLLGPNGAGKTTLIHIVTGLLEADAGSVRVLGQPPSAATKRLLGVVPQEVSVYQNLTCEENLQFFGKIYGLPRSRRLARIDELIETFNLHEYRHVEVFKLSGGWQRRLNIAAALVHSPSLLILDEPTAGLDVEARFELWRTLEQLRDSGVTVLLTTHHLEEAERLCSTIAILRDGRIAASGSLADLRARVPARQLAVVAAEDVNAVCERAHALGWSHRDYAGKLTLLLPEPLTLKDVVDRFDTVGLSTVSLRPIGLEHVYLEVTTPSLA